MSWIDRIENVVFTIKTGDGQMFYPDLPVNYQTTKDFSATKFEFIDQPGSLIDRKKVQARLFPLTFYFQGEDNVEQAEAFDLAANDQRAWTVRHPFYGDITGQPMKISRDDTKFNCTEITVDFWETIVTNFPAATIAPADAVLDRVNVYHEDSSTDYANTVSLAPHDVSAITDNASKIDILVAKAMDTVHYAEYRQLSATAFVAIDNAIAAPFNAMYAIQALCLLPTQLDTAVSYRIQLILDIYGTFIDSLAIEQTPNSKVYFEAAAGFAISALSFAMLNPLSGDFITRSQISAAATILVNTYNNYLTNINAGYVPINNITGAYSGSYNTQSTLQGIILQALTGLNTLAFNAKQERQVILDRNSQLIVLTHKYMGLDPLDANIETFRTINNIKNNSLFLIPKGSTIIYYA